MAITVVLLALHMGFHLWLIWREWHRGGQAPNPREILHTQSLRPQLRGPWVDLKKCARQQVPASFPLANWMLEPRSAEGIAAHGDQPIWLHTEGRN